MGNGDMTDFGRQSELTDASSVSRDKLARTVPGMAHFAGTGPVGATCSECDFWRQFGNQKKPSCEKFRLITGHSGKPVPGFTPACRYFNKRAGGAA
ncbi:hypothetical protein [Mesorhizobium sp.]|uniref:hypothetical protein n=1 Tax=Mesorhizobium sp. TaxID=1871066 RepID=UPI000FEA6FD1|nr:hypothetical protein [Mesorhizobium sp.]RWP64141.1 MAG: hypothetical protein EOR07_16270 [Mesorhizobium sp.]